MYSVYVLFSKAPCTKKRNQCINISKIRLINILWKQCLPLPRSAGKGIKKLLSLTPANGTVLFFVHGALKKTQTLYMYSSLKIRDRY